MEDGGDPLRRIFDSQQTFDLAVGQKQLGGRWWFGQRIQNARGHRATGQLVDKAHGAVSGSGRQLER